MQRHVENTALVDFVTGYVARFVKRGIAVFDAVGGAWPDAVRLIVIQLSGCFNVRNRRTHPFAAVGERHVQAVGVIPAVRIRLAVAVHVISVNMCGDRIAVFIKRGAVIAAKVFVEGTFEIDVAVNR